MALVRIPEPRSVFFALPFDVRDKLRGYKEAILVLEDKFNIKIKHGDSTTDAVGILDRANALMQSCRVRIFDMTDFRPNVVFEFGLARGAGLENNYAIRRKRFGDRGIPTMMNNIDCQTYTNAKQLEKILSKALEAHFWPTDSAFTQDHNYWLAKQIKELTHPGCETDKFELSEAIGIDGTFITQTINQFFVPAGDAVALTVGPSPRYKFDYNSIRPVPSDASSMKAVN